MAGLNDRRMLGTESGRIRRAARQVERAGGNPLDLLNRAAQVKLGEGSAISSSEENIAFDQEKRRIQSGLLESKRRALLNPAAARQAFDADLDRSASVKTDPAARQRAYERGATLGATREQIDQRIGGTTPQSTGTAPQSTGTATSPIGSTPRPTLQGPPVSAKPGLIDGKPARSVLDSMRGGETEPGNLTGLANRDAQDRAAAVTAARTESAGETSTTRADVVGRINKERTAKGLQPFGDDIYRDITAQEVAEGERATKGRDLSRAAGNVAEVALTPLQKSLADAKTRFAPPPAEEPQLPVYPVPVPDAPSAPTLTPARGLAGRFGSNGNAKFFGPEGYVDPKHAAKVAEMDAARKAREEKNRLNMGTLFPRKRPMDNLFGSKASFLEGSLVGKAYDALNK
jgi:uncharacterized protein YkwD